MADWYQVTESRETVHVWASNTRTAFDKGFRLLCGREYKLPPGYQMTIICQRLRGGSQMVKDLEKVYQETKKKRYPFKKRDEE